MLFNSATFAVFIAVVLALYALLRATGPRKAMLLIASYAFYANWDWRFLPLLLLSTFVDYFAGIGLASGGGKASRRLWMGASLLVNLGLLAFFKYGNFLIDSLAPLWSALDVTLPRLPTEIPVGISFYSFQTLSYTLDVYRRRIEPCRSPLDFALYVAFFPQLVAGPIVRSEDLIPQFRVLRNLDWENIAAGTQRFLLGLFKKVVIADNVALMVSAVFSAPEQRGALTLWCGAWGFALQIYCDFSAYTDMALGLGRAFGIPLPENFNAPYLARSITEFWRRWHMSLSTWLRDYLYIPLGGSRGGPLLTYRNLMLTMLLGGLWHGASWTFVAWGGMHGALLALERRFGRREPARESPAADAAVGNEGDPARWTAGDILRALVTFNLVCVAWVMFRAQDFHSMGTYLRRMFTAWGEVGEVEATALWWALAVLVYCVGQAVIRRRKLRERLWDPLHPALQGAALAALVLTAALLHVNDVAFIYFQF